MIDVEKELDDIFNKRNIDQRQNKGEYVDVSEIFEETAEVGKFLEKAMGKDRFNAALKALEEEDSKDEY